MKQAILVLFLIMSLLVNVHVVWDRMDSLARADEYVRANTRLMVVNFREALSSLNLAQASNWTEQRLLLQAANSLSAANSTLRTATNIATLASTVYRDYVRALPFEGLDAFSRNYSRFIQHQARNLYDGLPLDVGGLEKVMNDLTFANFPIQILDQPEQWIVLREAANRLVAAVNTSTHEDFQNIREFHSTVSTLPDKREETSIARYCLGTATLLIIH